MILANTGLIQKLSQYKVGRSSSTKNIIAYQNFPSDLASYTAGHENAQFAPQDVVFCVDYFVQRITVTDPTRWECTCLWVFELTDMYLTLARKNAMKDWAAEGWLQASIEFSTFSFPSVSSALDTALADANDYSLYSHILPLESDELEGKLTDDFVLMLCQYETALLVGISLSLAVLKNASEHFTLTSVPEKRISRQRLLLYQMMKIFHLKSKSSKILELLRAMKVSSKRKRQSNEKLSEVNRKQSISSPINGTRNCSEVGVLQLSITVENAAREVDKIHLLLFSDQYLLSKTLWQVLQGNDLNNTILRLLKEKVLARTQFMPFDLTMISFHSMLFEELALTTSFLSEDVDLTVQSLVQSMKAIVDFYIHIRETSASHAVDAQALDVVIQLARSYCKLLAAILTVSQVVDFEDWVDGGSKNIALLELVAFQLQSMEDIGIAHFQLDIISCLVKRSDAKYLDRIIEISWSSLHDVYSGSIDLVSEDWQRHLSRMVQAKKTKDTPEVKIPLESLLEAVAQSCRCITVKAFSPYCLSVIRHFALISVAPDQLSRYSHHVVKLLKETDSLARALHATIRGEKLEIDGKQGTIRAIPASCFPFLNSITLPDFFSTFLSLTTLLMGGIEPTRVAPTHEGPYQHLKFTLGVFRRLVSIFRDHFAIFPSRNTRTLSKLSRDFTGLMIWKLRQCVHWRNKQPILAVAQRASAIDVGSLSYLDDLIHLHMSPVIGDLSSLCDFFVERTDGPYFPFKRTNLRAIVEKAGREIQKIADVHNLSSPTLLPLSLPKLDTIAISTEESRNLDNGEHGEVSNMAKRNEDASVSVSGSDDDSSFGVSGEWGTSDDESTKGIDCQPTTLIKRS
jgi:hypothetical protein